MKLTQEQIEEIRKRAQYLPNNAVELRRMRHDLHGLISHISELEELEEVNANDTNEKD